MSRINVLVTAVFLLTSLGLMKIASIDAQSSNISTEIIYLPTEYNVAEHFLMSVRCTNNGVVDYSDLKLKISYSSAQPVTFSAEDMAALRDGSIIEDLISSAQGNVVTISRLDKISFTKNKIVVFAVEGVFNATNQGSLDIDLSIGCEGTATSLPGGGGSPIVEEDIVDRKIVYIDDEIENISTRVKVWRFFNKRNGAHLYTINGSERSSVQQLQDDWTYEGEKFFVESIQVEGSTPVYRFFNKINGAHLYTISTHERDTIINTNPDFIYEGIKYYVFENGKPGTIPVFRFFNKSNGAHVYTISVNEKDTLIQIPELYSFEGEKYFVYVDDGV